jgi:hypothetical protein
MNLPNDCDLKFKLAPCFGPLTGDAMKEMDKVISIMASVTLNVLIKATQNRETLTWEKLRSALLNNPALERDHENDHYRVATFKASQGACIPSLGNQETKCWQQRKEASGKVRNDTCGSTDRVLEVRCMAYRTYP